MQKTFLDFLQNRAKVLVSLALLAVSCHVSAEIIFGEYGSDEEDETPKEVKIMPLVRPRPRLFLLMRLLCLSGKMKSVTRW